MAQFTTSMRLSIFLLISFRLIVGRLGWAVDDEGTVWVGTRRSPTVECFHMDCNSGSMFNVNTRNMFSLPPFSSSFHGKLLLFVN